MAATFDPFAADFQPESHELKRARARENRLAQVAAAREAERTISPLPALTSPNYGVNEYLRCPRCGALETHLEKIRAGIRGEDDQPTLVDLDIVSGSLTFTPYDDENHIERSSRRQWLELVIDCEHCEGGTLVLAQHKGVTLVKYILSAARDGLFEKVTR